MEYLTAVLPYLSDEMRERVQDETWQLWENIWSSLSEEERVNISRHVRANLAVEREEAKRMFPYYMVMYGLITMPD